MEQSKEIGASLRDMATQLTAASERAAEKAKDMGDLFRDYTETMSKATENAATRSMAIGDAPQQGNAHALARPQREAMPSSGPPGLGPPHSVQLPGSQVLNDCHQVVLLVEAKGDGLAV